MGNDKPKGIVYFDMPDICNTETQVAMAIQKTLGWSPDPVIDSGKGNYSSPFQLVFFTLINL